MFAAAQYREGTVQQVEGDIGLCELGSCTYGVHHPNLQVVVDAINGHRRRAHPELYALDAPSQHSLVLADREAELLDAKGPCADTECRLHRAHRGPCDTRPSTTG